VILSANDLVARTRCVYVKIRTGDGIHDHFEMEHMLVDAQLQVCGGSRTVQLRYVTTETTRVAEREAELILHEAEPGSMPRYCNEFLLPFSAILELESIKAIAERDPDEAANRFYLLQR
jgi:hypothetical protein